jgi:hypothetical protein
MSSPKKKAADAARMLRHWEQVLELKYGGDITALPRFERVSLELARTRCGGPPPDWKELWETTSP